MKDFLCGLDGEGLYTAFYTQGLDPNTQNSEYFPVLLCFPDSCLGPDFEPYSRCRKITEGAGYIIGDEIREMKLHVAGQDGKVVTFKPITRFGNPAAKIEEIRSILRRRGYRL